LGSDSTINFLHFGLETNRNGFYGDVKKLAEYEAVYCVFLLGMKTGGRAQQKESIVSVEN
jgi:hypothetical protein